MSINITVKDRNEQILINFPAVEMDTTVQDFKKLFVAQCEMAKKRKLYPARLRFTLSEAGGTPLADATKQLSHYIEEPTATLYFKDLGPQIGWDTVFYVEYAGPIIITLLLLLLREPIYGENPALHLN